MAIAFYVSVVLATQGSEQMDIPVTPAAEAVLLTLRVRMNDSQLAGLTLANAFHYLAGIVGKQTFDLIDWSSNGGRVALRWLIQILEEHSSILAAAADPQLRSSVSEVLWSLSRWYSLPESLSAILEKLKTDNRARVRFWANGGWRARHAEIPA